MNLEIEKNFLKEETDRNVGSDGFTHLTEDEKIDMAAARILREYRAAFEELAK